jgi:hypothetical protein
MRTSEDEARVAALYTRFAEQEAHGRSAVYEAVCRGIAADEELVAWIARLPVERRQPNLLLGAVKLLAGTARDWPDWRARWAAHRGPVDAVVRTRTTQTNEPARTALVLPVLASLPGPLALLEVGASAGLCLLPDRYGFDYGATRLAPGGPAAPTFRLRIEGPVPVPERIPAVAWRAGLDLAPPDIDDPDAIRWLEALIWPGEEERLERLHAALRVARAERPRVERGDLRTDPPTLAARAPEGATLVVFHTAVLAYVREPEDRAAFDRTVAGLGARHLACEAPQVIPGIGSGIAAEGERGEFLVALDGEPLAWADPHATWLRWRS